MTKQEFLSELERALGKLPHAESSRRSRSTTRL